MRTYEPSKEEVDARGIIEERRRLGEVNEKNLPVKGVEKPTPQTAPEAAGPVISNPGASSDPTPLARICLNLFRKTF